MRKPVQIEFDPHSADALALLLQHHLEDIIRYRDQNATAEQVWTIHLIKLLLAETMPNSMRKAADTVADIAEEYLPSRLRERATACRRLN